MTTKNFSDDTDVKDIGIGLDGNLGRTTADGLIAQPLKRAARPQRATLEDESRVDELEDEIPSIRNALAPDPGDVNDEDALDEDMVEDTGDEDDNEADTGLEGDDEEDIDEDEDTGVTKRR